MRALIFAAGLGTRLRPITDSIPKALLEINKVTLLENAINSLKLVGVDYIVINVHYFADLIEDFVKKNNYFGITIKFSDERDALLNTGGGLKKASCFLDGDEPFFVYNVDVVSTIDLKGMYLKHIENDAIATLAVLQRRTSRYLLFDGNDRLCAWENRKTLETKIANRSSLLLPLAFSGIQVVSPEIFNLINEEGAFSIIDVYLRLAVSNKIICYNHTGDLWVDIGKIEELEEAKKIFNQIYC
ncbi:MAG: nucleotidyltransferase family protein [Bacteroidales bacterium]|nr:nucleotidyltransferase family protein [Bacteroidales bacterium]